MQRGNSPPLKLSLSNDDSASRAASPMMHLRAAAWTKGWGEEREERRVLQRVECRLRSQERTVSEAEAEEEEEEEEDEANIPLSIFADKHLQTACSAATVTRGLPLAA